MKGRMDESTRKKRRRAVARLFNLTVANGETNVETYAYLSEYCGVTLEAVRRWHRGISVPTGPRWIDVQEILKDLTTNSKAKPKTPVERDEKEPVQLEISVDATGKEAAAVWDRMAEAICGTIDALPRAYKILIWHKLGADMVEIHKELGGIEVRY